jgi:phosphate transport system permease protein
MAQFSSGFRNYLDRQADGTVRLWAALGVSLAATFLAFLVGSSFTIVPLAATVGTVGYGWYAREAATAKALSFVTTIATVAILLLIIVFLFREAVPAFQHMGLDMLTGVAGEQWSPANDVYSLVPMIWGTLVVTAVAMAIAAPLGLAGALFISEIAPSWAREIVKPGVELMAGIPSIVYGFIGLFVISEYFSANLEAAALGGSLFVAGMVVGVMAVPTVVSVAEDALSSVPEAMQDGSLAMGATDWQTIKSVTIPAAFSGVSAAVLLGVGRAIGETMAMTVILAHTATLPEPLHDVFQNTEALTSVIAFEYGNASGLHLSALNAAGVLLFLTVLTLSVGSQYVEVRMERKLGGKQ